MCRCSTETIDGCRLCSPDERAPRRGAGDIRVIPHIAWRVEDTLGLMRATSFDCLLNHAGEREQALLNQNRDLAGKADGLAALVENARVPL